MSDPLVDLRAMKRLQDRHLLTACVHAGETIDPSTKSVPTPIYQSAVYAFDSMRDVMAYNQGTENGSQGYMYSRPTSPTQRVLEKKAAVLECGEDALATSSGMAATTTAILSLTAQGDEIISSDMIYGGTYTFLKHTLPMLGIRTQLVDTRNIEAAEKQVTEKTKIIFVETPTNPDLRIANLESAARIAKAHGLKLIVDNTFATPVNQTPLTLGADVVIVSTTKYYGGHNDLIGGMIVGSSEFIAHARKTLKIYGGTIDPFAAYLTLRGLKTLTLRMEKHNSNAMKIAEHLEKHHKVKRVYYPGLRSHPQHELAKHQMSGFGGMMCFELESEKEAVKFIEGLKLIIHGLSLGGVESLVSMPVYSSHYYLTPQELQAIGLNNRMVRLSVGIEDAEDIISDLENALAQD
ncbi:MAG TPA: PLP-dependent aspartate aminotransferase family protein [Candidatus Acidoferrales bacterium]|nr:PLP-dependent aspartate aminotransferase family protein [Candidatus Acidoferrales bacterium]